MEAHVKDKNSAVVLDIMHSVVLNSPVNKVWDAISTADSISSWFMKNDLKPEEGNKFTIHSIFGPAQCEVLKVEPPNNLSFTWDSFGWRVSFELKDAGDATRFTVVHSGWGTADKIIPGVYEKSSEIRDRMKFGWKNAIDRLQAIVE